MRSAAALLLGLLLLGPSVAALDGGSSALLVVAGKEPTGVLIVDGRIAAHGPVKDGLVGRRPIPPGTETLRFPDGEILPGYIDAGSLLAGDRPDVRTVTADVRAVDGFDPYADRRRVLAAGVTTVAVDPGRGRLVPGISGVVRLGGGRVSGRVLVREAALHIVLTAGGRNPPRVYDPPVAPDEGTAPLDPAKVQLPTTLAGAALRLRELFRMAAGGSSSSPGELDPLGLATLDLARRGEIRVVVHADRAAEIRTALALVEEFGLDAILAGGEEAGPLASEIKAAGVPVILDTRFRPGAMPANESPEDIERRERSFGSAAALHQAGVPVCFRSSGDPADLPFLAAQFLGDGFSDGALRHALTLGAARILGIADRVGALKPGLEADLVVEGGGGVDLVVAGGEVVYRRPRSEELLVVKAGRLYVGDGSVLEDASVLLSGGKILEVGAAFEPGPARHLSGPVVVPGFIDAQGYLGLLDPDGGGKAPSSFPLGKPLSRALSPGDPNAEPVYRAGITTYLAAPPASGTVAGLGSVVHTVGRSMEELVLAERGAVFFTVAGARDLPMTLAKLGDTLKAARSYADGFDAYAKAKEEYDAWVAGGKKGAEKKPVKAPRTDENREPYRDLFAGRLPAIVKVSTETEARETLKLFTDEYGLEVILSGADRCHGMALEMAKRGAAVLLGPRLIVDSPRGPVNLPAVYSRAGVSVLFGSSATTGAASLPATVAHAVSRGFGPGAALRAFTGGAAERLGIADRTGTIREGLTADLLVLSGPPFAPGTRVVAVIRGGRVVYAEGDEK